MNGKALTIAALTGTIALMAWQSVSHTLLPWHMATLKYTTDSTAAAMQTVRQLAPENGMYVNTYGLMMAVSPTADVVDKTTLLGPMLGKQFAINLVAVLLLCVLVGRVGNAAAMHVGVTAALFAAAMVGVKELSDWNWYGFGMSYSLVNLIDQTIGWFIAGWTVSTMLAKFGGSATGRDGQIVVPEGAGYRSPGAPASTTQ